MTLRTVTPALLRAWPLPRPEGDDDKEARGRVLVVGGSRAIPGAALLAATACLRVGAGKLQIATVEDAAMPLAIAMPEAKVIGVPGDADGEIARPTRALLSACASMDAVLVGPGMLDTHATHRFAATLMRRARAVVLDAGAMGACMSTRAGTLVITPHHGEMAALCEVDAARIAADPEGIAREAARQADAIVVLKAATTIIATPEGDAWRHDVRCTGLGVSGSGDVLAGCIAGLIAGGADVAQAAVWGVALHARAGVALSKHYGDTGFLAREIVAAIALV